MLKHMRESAKRTMHNEFFIDTESGCIMPNEVAVDTANRALVHRPASTGSGDSLTPKMIDADSIAKTQKLLDKAIAYAWYTVKSERRPPVLTPRRWVWQLASSYHLTHSTPRLMEEARKRFVAVGCESLAQWAAQKVREELGHDQLALLDIQSMGYDALAVVKALLPPAAKSLVNYFTQSVQATDPISCVGYSYTMERLALGITEKYIQVVEALLPSGMQATRCLRVHSSVGSDVEHVKEMVEMVAGLAPQKRVRVGAACYETALLYFRSSKEGCISEEELQNVLEPLKLHTHACG